jgi:hypothetical protein
MHYGDTRQLESAVLVMVIYKHGTWLTEGYQERGKLRTKAGVIRKDCVDYHIASVQEMKFFPPRVFQRMVENPYQNFSKTPLDALPFEEWYLVRIVDLDGYGRWRLEVMGNVSLEEEELYRLH